MLRCLALLLASQSPAPIERDAFGVPHIQAATAKEAFFHAGFAVAQDRLWQMEQSRRAARGRLAEVFGPSAAAGDRDTLAFAYTDEELRRQIAGTSARTREALEAYAEGVNAYMAQAIRNNQLPPGYEEHGFKPEPWTTLDSAAISIRMGQLFGRGGAGELRNLALIEYLKTQPVKDRILDVLDDFLWQNDPASPTTVRDEDDAVRRMVPPFNLPTRAETEKHLAQLPKVSLLELMPALRMASREDSRLLAERHASPFKTGSYAVVVGSQRSATGRPLLLSAPQMGFTIPSIIHEMSISTPQWGVAGLDVPGAPGVVIGHSRHAAWGITSGVADTEDIFFVRLDGDDGYRIGEQALKFERVSLPLKVKGQPDQTVTQLRTTWGPVMLVSKAPGVAFVRRSAYWMRELSGFDAMRSFYEARSAAEIDRAAQPISLTFNLFYATNRGEIGYRYCGLVPIRARGLDPRLPAPAEPANDWRGFIPAEQMPRVLNPRDGLIVNWNNKPVSWWPNGDTPAWGRVFRVALLNRQLNKPKLSVQDVEMAAWSIARHHETAPFFHPALQSISPAGLSDLEREALAYLQAFDGRTLAGSQSAAVYRAWFLALREELFVPSVGNFLQPTLFQTAVQPSVMLNALERKTKVDYLQGRTREQVARDALKKAVAQLVASSGPLAVDWRFQPTTIPAPSGPPIPYRDRGSYIQIVELAGTVRGRNVLPPGVAESGPHSADQVPLARAWTYKEMKIR